MTNVKPKQRVIDSIDVQETYANKLIGTGFDGGALSVTLGATRFVPDRIDDPPRDGHPPSVYVTTRIAISPACAIELVNALNQMLSVIAANANQQKIVPIQTQQDGSKAH